MSFLQELFGRKRVTTRDLKTRLLRIERDRRRKRLELKKLDKRQGEIVEQVKEARRSGNNIEVDYLWEDLKGMKIDRMWMIRESTILNLEGITVKKYLRGMERMERNNNHEGINKMMERIRGSGLEAKLDADRIATDEYLDELRAIMDDVGMDMESMDMVEDDQEKAAFLADIDAINVAEESGNLDEVEEAEERLTNQLEEETEEP